VFVAVVVGYGVAGSRNEFVYDDVQLLLQKDAATSWREVGGYFGEAYLPGFQYYRPVTQTTLLVQKALHGDHPAPYRWFNAALAGLVFLVCFALLSLPAFDVGRGAALWGAAVCALHPVASSCVYPITGREALLSSLLALVSLYGFLRRGPGWAAGAVISFGLALFAREHVIVLPALFLLAEGLGLEGARRDSRRRIVFYGSLAVILLVYLAIRHALFAESQLRFALFADPWGPAQSLLYGAQVALAPFWELRYEPSFAVWLSLPRVAAAVVGWSCLGWLAWRHGSRLRTPILFCLAWVVVTQLPTANILLQETRFSERHVFLSIFGVVAAVACVASRTRPGPAVKRAAAVVGCAVLAWFATTSLHRASYFRDALTFTRQWVHTNPDSASAHMGVGLSLARRGEHAAAVEHFGEAVRLRPGYTHAYGNLGHAWFESGRWVEAVEAYRSALDLDPKLVEAAVRMGDALRQLQRFDEALAAYRQALAADPENSDGRVALGNTLLAMGRGGEALVEFAEAARLAPDHVQAHFNLGATLLEAGRTAEAVGALRRAVELDPMRVEAHTNLGVALFRLDEFNEAIGEFREAVRCEPGRGASRLNLARALEQRGRTSEAIDQYREALRIDPGSREASTALARLSAAEEP
jgi:tetratricopeptide (TPR) repeat protein